MSDSIKPVMELDWVYGANPTMLHVISEYNDDSERTVPSPLGKDAKFLYVSGNVGIIYDSLEKTQILLRGHRNPIRTSAITPDKKIIATACDGPNSSIFFWSSDGDLLAEVLPPNGVGTASIDFSPDGRQLVVLSGLPEKKSAPVSSGASQFVSVYDIEPLIAYVAIPDDDSAGLTPPHIPLLALLPVPTSEEQLSVSVSSVMLSLPSLIEKMEAEALSAGNTSAVAVPDVTSMTRCFEFATTSSHGVVFWSCTRLTSTSRKASLKTRSQILTQAQLQTLLPEPPIVDGARFTGIHDWLLEPTVATLPQASLVLSAAPGRSGTKGSATGSAPGTTSATSSGAELLSTVFLSASCAEDLRTICSEPGALVFAPAVAEALRRSPEALVQVTKINQLSAAVTAVSGAADGSLYFWINSSSLKPQRRGAPEGLKPRDAGKNQISLDVRNATLSPLTPQGIELPGEAAGRKDESAETEKALVAHVRKSNLITRKSCLKVTKLRLTRSTTSSAASNASATASTTLSSTQTLLAAEDGLQQSPLLGHYRSQSSAGSVLEVTIGVRSRQRLAPRPAVDRLTGLLASPKGDQLLCATASGAVFVYSLTLSLTMWFDMLALGPICSIALTSPSPAALSNSASSTSGRRKEGEGLLVMSVRGHVLSLDLHAFALSHKEGCRGRVLLEGLDAPVTAVDTLLARPSAFLPPSAAESRSIAFLEVNKDYFGKESTPESASELSDDKPVEYIVLGLQSGVVQILNPRTGRVLRSKRLSSAAARSRMTVDTSTDIKTVEAGLAALARRKRARIMGRRDAKPAEERGGSKDARRQSLKAPSTAAESLAPADVDDVQDDDEEGDDEDIDGEKAVDGEAEGDDDTSGENALRARGGKSLLISSLSVDPSQQFIAVGTACGQVHMLHALDLAYFQSPLQPVLTGAQTGAQTGAMTGAPTGGAGSPMAALPPQYQIASSPFPLLERPQAITRLQFSPDGLHCAGADAGGRVFVLRLVRTCARRLVGGAGRVPLVQRLQHLKPWTKLSADTGHLVSTECDAWTSVGSAHAHGAAVTGLAFSPAPAVLTTGYDARSANRSAIISPGPSAGLSGSRGGEKEADDEAVELDVDDLEDDMLPEGFQRPRLIPRLPSNQQFFQHNQHLNQHPEKKQQQLMRIPSSYGGARFWFVRSQNPQDGGEIGSSSKAHLQQFVSPNAAHVREMHERNGLSFLATVSADRHLVLFDLMGSSVEGGLRAIPVESPQFTVGANGSPTGAGAATGSGPGSTVKGIRTRLEDVARPTSLFFNPSSSNPSPRFDLKATEAGACQESPGKTKEEVLLTYATDTFKLRTWALNFGAPASASETEARPVQAKCVSTLSAPEFGGALTSFVPLVPKSNDSAVSDSFESVDSRGNRCNRRLFDVAAFGTDQQVLGLMALPLSGSPFGFAGAVGHVGPVQAVLADSDGSGLYSLGYCVRAFTSAVCASASGPAAPAALLEQEGLRSPKPFVTGAHVRLGAQLLRWRVDQRALLHNVASAGGSGKDALSTLGSLLPGGEVGPAYRELCDFFSYAQVHSQGELSALPRKAGILLPYKELIPLLHGLGCFLSRRDEAAVLEQGLRASLNGEVDLTTALQIYLDFRPAVPPKAEDVKAAMSLLLKHPLLAQEVTTADGELAVKFKTLLQMLMSYGEGFQKEELESCIAILQAKTGLQWAMHELVGAKDLADLLQLPS